MRIAIYTLTSELHDEQAVEAVTQEFLGSLGVGIRGYMKEGPVTIFKLSGDLSRSFIAEGELLENQAKPDLCRTQQVIRLADPSQASYFLTNPIGNHHIVLPGHHRALLEEVFI